MSKRYVDSLSKVLSRTSFAITGKPLFSGSQHAAKVFLEILDYFGMEVVSNCGLVVHGDKIVQIDEDGKIHLPDLRAPYSPEVARALGEALIAAANISRSQDSAS